MAQNVQLQQVVVDGVIIKVGGDGIRGHIIGGMLYRREGMDLLSVRQYHNSTGVLTCRAAHPYAALDDPVDLTVALVLAPLLVIILYITKGCLVRQGTNSSRAEGLALAENNFCIFVSLGLIVAGEIQVNIRLLVTLKAQEGFKWNIKALFFQRRATHRALLIRHIAAGCARVFAHFLRLEVTVVTLGAIIMGRQGIYLGNARHGSYKGRSYRTTGTHQITVLIGLPHQLLSNDIHNRKSIGNNGMQLFFQSLRYLSGQFCSVDGVCLFIADVTQGLV